MCWGWYSAAARDGPVILMLKFLPETDFNDVCLKLYFINLWAIAAWDSKYWKSRLLPIPTCKDETPSSLDRYICGGM